MPSTSSPKSKLCYVVGYPLLKEEDLSLAMPVYAQKLVEFPARLFPQVTIIGPEEQRQRFTADRIAIDSRLSDIRLIPLQMCKNRVLRWFKQLPQIWRSIGCTDLVCVNIPEEASFLAAVVCRLRKKALLVQVLGDWEEAVRWSDETGLQRRVKSWFGGWLARFTVRSAQLVFTQGQALFDKFRPDNPAAVKSAVVHTTLSDDLFVEQDRKPFHEPLRLLTVSRLSRGKGLEILIQALETLQRRGVSVEWWCVGRGPQSVELRDSARLLGVSNSVRFFGFVGYPSLTEIYRNADIFVLPSYTEGIPNVMLEAMAQSLPVIVTAVGGIPGVVESGVDGLLIAPRSAEAIVEAVLRLKSDVDLTNRIRRNGYSTALRYRVSELHREHEALIEATFGEIQVSRKSNLAPQSRRDSPHQELTPF